MLRIVCTIMLVITSICVQAQKKTEFKGTVADSSSKELLEMATVTVQNAKDSSLLTYTLTNKKGEFKLPGVPSDINVRVLISYTGYRTIVKRLEAGSDPDLGMIHLAPAATELNTVVIEGDRPPVVFRKDTIEFNASSFKTRNNAVVEDLLKKLPGLDIDPEGNITVNGKKVSRILVDGQDFFANNPGMATKNLPADIIDKVQVVDTKTRQEAKMGTRKDGEDKTLNLTLKPDKKRGVFGKLSAGGGTDERFELAGMFNGFEGSRQLSVLGASNNLNKPGFSPADMMNSGAGGGGGTSATFGMPMMEGLMGGGEDGGIRTATTAGFNYNDQWNKTYLNSTYSFDNTNTRSQSNSSREYLNADGHLFSNSGQNGYNRSNSHSLNFALTTDLDSSLMFSWTPVVSYNNSSSNNIGMETTRREDGSMVNTNETGNRSVNKGTTIGNNFSFTKMMKKTGRSLGLQIGHSNGNNTSDAYNLNDVNYYENDVITDSKRLDQKTISDNTTASYNANLTFTETLSKTWGMNLGYGFNYTSNTSNRQTFNYDPVKKDYTELDDTYTNKFRTKNISQSPNVGFNYYKDKVQANIGATMYLNILDNYTYTTNTTLRQNQNNFSPNARISYTLKDFSNISLGYMGMMQQPSLDQLQPVPDNTNTLNQRIGNPDLKPSFQQNFMLSFMKFSPTGLIIFSSMNFTPVLNRFSTASFTNARGERTTQAINVDGTYNIMGNFSVTKMKKTTSGQYRFSLGGRISGNRNISFSNSGNAAGDTTLNRNISINMSYAPNLTVNYSYKEWFETVLTYRPSFTDARYKPVNTTQGSYTAHMANLGTSVYWPKNFTWDNDVNYMYNSRITPGFKKDVTLWNMSLAYDYKALQFKLSGFDLLHQNTSVRRVVNEQYIEDVQSAIVDQYFMLTLTWNFSKFGAKPIVPGAKRRMEGRMMPGM